MGLGLQVLGFLCFFYDLTMCLVSACLWRLCKIICVRARNPPLTAGLSYLNRFRVAVRYVVFSQGCVGPCTVLFMFVRLGPVGNGAAACADIRYFGLAGVSLKVGSTPPLRTP